MRNQEIIAKGGPPWRERLDPVSPAFAQLVERSLVWISESLSDSPMAIQSR
jgi:hypothetical protein